MSFITTKCGYIGTTKPMPQKTEEEILPLLPPYVKLRDEAVSKYGKSKDNSLDTIEPLLPPTFLTRKNSKR